MRKQLEELTDAERHTFTATFDRYGTRPNWHGYPEQTLLLTNVMLGDSVVCDHIWLVEGKRLKAYTFESGDRLEFCARVGLYRKGYYHDEYDYCLKYPTAIRKLPPQTA